MLVQHSGQVLPRAVTAMTKMAFGMIADSALRAESQCSSILTHDIPRALWSVRNSVDHVVNLVNVHLKTSPQIVNAPHLVLEFTQLVHQLVKLRNVLWGKGGLQWKQVRV